MRHADNDRGRNFRKNHVITFRTAHHAFLLVMLCFRTAASAETIAAIPVKQMPRRHHGIADIFGFHLTQCHGRLIAEGRIRRRTCFAHPNEVILLLHAEHILYLVFIPMRPAFFLRPCHYLRIGRQNQCIIFLTFHQ